MALKFTLRTIAGAVAAFAVGMGALLNPTTRVAMVVVNGVLSAMLVAACLAVGSRQPARSFWLGFALACIWTLVIDELGRRDIITPVVLTRTLVSMMEEVLPPVPPLRGEPGSTLYFRSGGRFPFYYYVMGTDGTPKAHGQMTLEQLRRDGVMDRIGPLRGLPHLDSIPRPSHRTTICRYVLAAFVGLVGGLLAYAARRHSDLRAASGSPA